MNYAVYASRLDDESQRDSTRIKLDADGNVINAVNPWGNPWAVGAIRDAQDGRAWLVMSDAMTFLDSVIGEDRDTSTVNAFNSATGRIEDAAHAEKLIEKLQIAALNGSEAALIGIVAASIFINRLAFVDFGWYVSAEEMADHEGFAVTLNFAPAQPAAPIVRNDATAPQHAAIIAQPAAPIVRNDVTAPQHAAIIAQPAAPIVRIDVVSSPPPRVIVTPLVIIGSNGRALTATADGWLAESESKPGNYYTTAQDGSTCSCWGHRRWGKCWHRTAVYAHNKRKRDTARPVSKRKPRKRGQIRPSKPNTARHTYHPPRPRSRSRMWK